MSVRSESEAALDRLSWAFATNKKSIIKVV